MECNDEAVERQQLVNGNDELDDDNTTTITGGHNGGCSTNKSAVPTPISPIKDFDSGPSSSARLMYINERKQQDPSKIDCKPKARKIQKEPVPSSSNANDPEQNPVNYTFADRPLKHHSFSEVPDVHLMERALLDLLDDFHSGKLRAFGSGCNEMMTDIREQQERLAKLHFELNGGENCLNGGSLNAQESMFQLVEKLENLSVSIERLHSNNVDI